MTASRPEIEDANAQQAQFLNEALDDALHEFMADQAATMQIAELSLAAACIENIATELGAAAPARTATFLRALADLIEAPRDLDAIRPHVEAVMQANRAMQVEITAFEQAQRQHDERPN